MTTLIDFIMDLFRSPDRAAHFIANPEQTLRDAGVPANVTAAQLQAVAATAAPAGVALGGGDPIVGLQRAVADHHNIASPFSPSYTSQPTFAPQTHADLASHNATEVASNNDFMSPAQHGGENAQNGAFNLGFGDITLGNKTSNTAADGSVVNTGTAGHIDTTNVKGDGNVVGDGNSANTGIIEAGSHSPVTVGHGNETTVHDSSQHAGGDVISDNDGPVIKDNDMSGGHGGNAGTSGGGSLIGIGNGGNEANSGGGGGGGSIVINDSHSNTNSGNAASTTAVGGNQTNAGHDVSSTANSTTSSNVHTDTTSHVDTSVHEDNSVHQDSSIHSDNSFSQQNSLHQTNETHFEPDTHIGF